MTQPREHIFSPCSARASGASARNTGMPLEAHLTAREADERTVNSSLCEQFSLSSAVESNPFPISKRLEMSLPQDKDPFVTPVRGTRLSPTASTFTPGTESNTVLSLDDVVYSSNALSSELGLSRVLRISSNEAIAVSEIEEWLSMMDRRNGDHPYGTRWLTVRGPSIDIAFTDLRDSIRAKDLFDSVQSIHLVEYLEPRDGPTDTAGDRGESAARGQVLVTATSSSPLNLREKSVSEAVGAALERYGRLFALVDRTVFPDGTFRAVAEFCSVDAADCAILACQGGIHVMGLNLMVKPRTEDHWTDIHLASLFRKMSPPSVAAIDCVASQQAGVRDIPQTTTSHLAHAFTMYPYVFSPQTGTPLLAHSYSTNPQPTVMGPLPPMTPMSPGYPMMRSMYHSPPSPAMTSQYSPSPSRMSSGYARPDSRRQGATRVTRSVHGTNNHHNHVDAARIREGIDVRTTIMLRNIPNKVDQAMLKRLVDESSWGKYDFMYLRIDFANDCNVGYAFINFVDPLDIVDFVEARGNQRWNCFKSDKVAEISYATIQGKDCLVQKFRNSSVMLEAPHYRPKLYFTSNGPLPELAGQEEPFPEPDNQSKMKRSCENAEHVGLFTPNAGQHFRDEQRRRRSQYDRGTRLAALEEYDFDAAVNRSCGAD